MANTLTAFDNWNNADTHVDQSIANGESFTSSAYTVVYAKLHSMASSNFKAIGVVQGWTATEQRQVDEIFELGSSIRYIIPGRTTGQISITRMMIEQADLINVLYAGSGNVYRSLKDLNVSLDLLFVMYDNNSDHGAVLTRLYENCWIVAKQESITANQVVIAENCTIVYEKIAATALKAIVDSVSTSSSISVTAGGANTTDGETTGAATT